MKKKLEGELISIAHRVLKLKNRSETIQLQEEAKKLYEQLTILRFYEENIELVENEIDAEKFEQVLGALDVNLNSEPEVDTLETKDIVAEFAEEMEEPIADLEENVEVFVEEVEEEQPQQEKNTVVEAKETAEEIQPQAALFDDVFAASYKEIDFVKVEDVPVEVEKANETIFEAVTPVEEVKEEIQPEPVVAETPKVLEEEVKATFEKVSQEPKISSLNDRLNKTISFGLNDRIGFEKKLFGGSSDDFNRVISQLNTFDSFEEAKSFVLDFVKPDYNNWEGNEEFEARFMEIIEKKFS